MVNAGGLGFSWAGYVEGRDLVFSDEGLDLLNGGGLVGLGEVEDQEGLLLLTGVLDRVEDSGGVVGGPVEDHECGVGFVDIGFGSTIWVFFGEFFEVGVAGGVDDAVFGAAAFGDFSAVGKVSCDGAVEGGAVYAGLGAGDDFLWGHLIS